MLAPQTRQKPRQITENLGPIRTRVDSKSISAGFRWHVCQAQPANQQWLTWNRHRHKSIQVLPLFLVELLAVLSWQAG